MMLSSKIHQLRKGRGMSQEDLASQLTVSRQAVSKWELGESVPDTENIVQLSKLFGVSTDYLLNDDYESDGDIPAVKASAANIKTQNRRSLRKAAYVLIAFGLVGILTFLILSSVIPAWRMASTWGYPPVLVDQDGTPYPDEYQIAPLGEQVRMYTSVMARGHLGAFLQTYHLAWAFALCCLSALTGLCLLLSSKNKKAARSEIPQHTEQED